MFFVAGGGGWGGGEGYDIELSLDSECSCTKLLVRDSDVLRSRSLTARP